MILLSFGHLNSDYVPMLATSLVSYFPFTPFLMISGMQSENITYAGYLMVSCLFWYGNTTILHLFIQVLQKLMEYLNLSKFLTLSYDRTCLCHHVLLRILVQANIFGFWYWYFLKMGKDFLYFTSFSWGFILLIKSHVLWAWLDAAMKYCLN